MRLDFNVLWVDDQPKAIAAQIKRIADDMQEHGFEFKPRLCESLEQLRDSLGDGVFHDKVDLVLVDWDLGNKVEGQNAIIEIRERIRYKDVVFYSGNKSADDLRKLVYESGQEGIYCVHRTELVEEVVGVFDSLIKKVLDLDHVRGIVLGATSDIDGIVLECLTHIHEKSEPREQAALLAEAIELIEARVKKTIKDVEKLRAANTFQNVLSAHAIFTSYDRARILSRLLDAEPFKAHNGYRPSVLRYMNESLPSRNEFGHMMMIAEGATEADIRNAKVMSLEETRLLRRQLLDLRADFRRLLTALQGPA